MGGSVHVIEPGIQQKERENLLYDFVSNLINNIVIKNVNNIF